eukprot:Hpha_TRINITY_DN5700_c1_g1::TRINITY_DN5700_c1_g1_i1::g.147521::m.147521/K19348/TMEM67, MKS3; meckelin
MEILLALYVQAAAAALLSPPSLVYPDCGETAFFDEALLSCRQCDVPERMVRREDGKGCRCAAGYAGNDCGSDCVARGLAADAAGSRCLPCADGSELDTTIRDCACAEGSVRVDEASGSPLPAKTCVECPQAIQNGRCVSCAALGRAETGGTCEGLEPCCGCEDGLYLNQGECLPVSPDDPAFRTATYVVWYPSGVAAQQSTVLEELAPLAYARCRSGWRGKGGCAMLANLCAAQCYDVDSAAAASLQMSGACGLYSTYLAQYDGGTGCTSALGCDRPRDLPWLFYQSAGAWPLSIVQRTMRYGVKLGDSLRLFVRRFSIEGEYLGAEPLLEHLSLCDMGSEAAEKAWRLGTNLRVGCYVNRRWLSSAPPPEVLEVFAQVPLQNGTSAVIDVPVRMAGVGWDADVFFKRGSSFLGPEDRLFRRFVLRENFLTTTMRYVSEVTFLAGIRDQSSEELLVPLITLKYAAFEPRSPLPASSASDTTTVTERGGEPLDPVLLPSTPGAVPKNVLSDSEGLRSELQVYYVADQSTLQETLLNLIISACCLCLVSAIFKTYVWSMRNSQTNSILAFRRFFVYYCSHFGNSFQILVVAVGLWFLCFYKAQNASSVMLPPPQAMGRYFTVLVWCSFAAKLADVLYRVMEQCRQWIFIVDWEVPRTQDQHIPIWRSHFVGNELNEVQYLLAGRPGLVLVITVFLLEGPPFFQGLSSAQPDTSDLTQEGSFSHPLLRIGAMTVSFLVATFAVWLFDFFFYRFVEVDPLRAVAELCSVANVSVLFVLEERWGYYLHGKSVHRYADTSLAELQVMLQRECHDRALPRRGLGGKSDCQCFEMFVNWSLHQELTQRRLEMDQLAQFNSGTGPQPSRLGDICFGAPRNPILSAELIAKHGELSALLRRLVLQEELAVRQRPPLHQLVGLPDQTVRVADFQSFATAAEVGTAQQGSITGGLAASKVSLYADAAHWPVKQGDAPESGWQAKAPARCFLWGLRGTISQLTLATLLAFDHRFANTYASAIVAYLVICGVRTLRETQGKENISRTSFIDQRFLL